VTNVKNNQRYQRTRADIIACFIGMLEETPPEKITVADICRAAKINRSTFYGHFTDVYDLMDQAERTVFDELDRQLDQWMGRPGVDVFRLFVDHVRDNKEFYAAYLGRNKGEPVFARMAEYRLSGNERLTHPQQSISPTQLEYRLRFFGAGYDAMIKLWIERGCKESPEELRSVFEPFMSTDGHGATRQRATGAMSCPTTGEEQAC